MYNNRFRGFTLIELLVVIAIIGILSAVVLASLNTARSKGNDAAIQSDLSTIHTQAEIYYGGTGNNSYGTAGTSCASGGGNLFDDTTIIQAITALGNLSGAVACNNSATAYAVSAQLTSDTSTYWCIDSTGFAGKRSSVLGTATVCPAS